MALALLLGAAISLPARAHPLDEANVYHFQACRVTREGLTLDYRVIFGGLVANRGWASIDADGDQTLSEAEQEAFALLLQRGVELKLDEVVLTHRLARRQFPSREEFFTGQFPYIQLVLEAPLPPGVPPGPHTVTIVIRGLAEYDAVFPRPLVSAAEEFQAALPSASEDGRTTEFRFVLPTAEPRPAAAAHVETAAATRPRPARAARRVSEKFGGPARTSPTRAPRAASPPVQDQEAVIPQSAIRHPRSEAPPSKTLALPDMRLELPRLVPFAPRERDRPILSGRPGPGAQPEAGDRPSLPPRPLAPSPPVPVTPSPPPSNSPLRDALRGPLGLGAMVLVLGTAVLLGMAHALTPGHGKTVVAAYLVGSRGTVWDAVFLGGVVTLTHTGSVLLLGVALLLASDYVLPQTVFPWLGVASGAIIVGMGFWMLIRGILAYHGVVPFHAHAHGHGHSHSHVRDPGQGVLGGAAVSGSAGVVHEHGPGHAHGHVHESAHSHAHSHPHEHGHDHGDGDRGAQEDEHGHDHTHHHAHPHPHVRPGVPRGASRWGLLSLGVAGGMVPCPDAIVVLLAAVSLNRIALGLSMLVAFSFGLAAVLIGIGILMVTASGWMQRWTGEGRLIRLLPAISGAVIFVLGFVIAIQALVAGGIMQIRV